MEFIAGLILGFLGGGLSWVAAAAWLEARRARSDELLGCFGRPATPGARGGSIHEHSSRV